MLSGGRRQRSGAELRGPAGSKLHLRRHHPEWAFAGIDGFCIVRATRASERGVRLLGTCILIADQRVTPFCVDVEVAPSGVEVASLWLRMGEPGDGTLGIAGPPWGSSEAFRLAYELQEREVPWVYEVRR